jgi:hypothetical protein
VHLFYVLSRNILPLIRTWLKKWLLWNWSLMTSMLAVCKYVFVSLFPRRVNYTSGNSLVLIGKGFFFFPLLIPTGSILGLRVGRVWISLTSQKKKGLSQVFFWELFDVYFFPNADWNLLLEKPCINIFFPSSKFSVIREFLVTMYGSVLYLRHFIDNINVYFSEQMTFEDIWRNLCAFGWHHVLMILALVFFQC